jgi:hypothetical protein
VNKCKKHEVEIIYFAQNEKKATYFPNTVSVNAPEIS